MSHLLILWRQLVRLAATAGQCFGSISKVFSALIIVNVYLRYISLFLIDPITISIVFTIGKVS